MKQENGIDKENYIVFDTKQENDVEQENGVDRENVFVFWSLVFCLLGYEIFFSHLNSFHLRRQKNISCFDAIFSVGACIPLI